MPEPFFSELSERWASHKCTRWCKWTDCGWWLADIGSALTFIGLAALAFGIPVLLVLTGR